VENDREFVIVVLDACRYGFFEEVYDEYLKGQLEKVWSSANNTPNYVASTWTNWHDLTYISTLPWASDMAWASINHVEPYLSEANHGYRPSEHLKDARNIWINRWNAVQFTVPPEATTQEAVNYLSSTAEPQLVVHYLQPHRPYIGEPKIDPWSETFDPDEVETVEDPDFDELFRDRTEVSPEEIYKYDIGWQEFTKYGLEAPRFDIKEAILSGDLSKERYREAYRGNLRLVLESVSKLVKTADCPVYITADHGEFLGEGGRVLHSNFTHPILREVPWLEVHGSRYTGEDMESVVETDQESDKIDNHNVKERLKQLGYLRG
jgi:hypothetical protein